MSQLSSVNAIVTGATRGLGLSFAKALADEGARVVINGRTDEACRAAAQSIDSTAENVQYVVGGVEQEETSTKLVDVCAKHFGPVNFVVNNAGVTRDKGLLRMSVDEFDEVIAVHLRGTWLMCRAAAGSMKSTGGGAILNLTSGTSLFGNLGQSNYAAAKGGVNALTRTLSLELARYSIRVNALYPVALTDMTSPVMELSGGDAAVAALFGDPDEVARIVSGLADPAAASITGQVLRFDGRRLTVWSHPEELYDVSHAAPWSATDLGLAMETLSARPAILNTDYVGVTTSEALSRGRRS